MYALQSNTSGESVSRTRVVQSYIRYVRIHEAVKFRIDCQMRAVMVLRRLYQAGRLRIAIRLPGWS